jgi:hypothetical protein
MFTVHLAVTWFMVGLIWVIQLIVYPQFLRVGAAEFRAYHFSHCLRIGLMIVPLVLMEAGSAAWLFYQGLRTTPFLISLGIIPLIGLSTAIWQAPDHTQLMQGYDKGVIRHLILTNWIRTLGWTARGVLLFFTGA